jgi:hypothetical protein
MMIMLSSPFAGGWVVTLTESRFGMRFWIREVLRLPLGERTILWGTLVQSRADNGELDVNVNCASAPKRLLLEEV